MFRISQQVVIVLLLVIPVRLSAVDSLREGDGWVYLKEKNQIRLYERKTSGYSEFKAETTARTSVAELITIAKYVSGYSEWLFRCTTSRKLDEAAGNSEVVYLTFDVPWPGKDRDVVLRITVKPGADSTKASVELESVPDLFPSQKQFVRMASVKGRFDFEAAQNGKTRIVHEFYMDPGNNLPGVAVNSPDFTYNTTDNLRRRAEN